MKRPVPPPQRGVLEIDWPLFGELNRALALKVAQAYDPDIVIGIARAGVIPGAVISAILQKDFAAMAVSRPSPEAVPELVSPPHGVIKGRKVLLVDETCDTGSTLRLALNEVRMLRPGEVKTAVSIVTGTYAPDFHALATEKLIILPWDREIVVNGEIVLRPDLKAYLAGV
jgi:hypothetical protein